MKKIIILLTALLLATVSDMAWGKIKIAASIPDLASIASYIGGDRVTTFAISRGSDDPHHVEILPSYMVKVSRADIYLKVGLGLDQWAAGIIDGARNGKLKVVECSMGVTILEKPTGRVSAPRGDVHPEGNPHFWLDPTNGAIVANTIAEALASIDPAGVEIYSANVVRFNSEVTKLSAGWKQRLVGVTAHPIMTYHTSWVYFASAFGFRQAGYVEPFPGVPPSASHLNDLIGLVKSQGVMILIQEPYFPDDAPLFLGGEAGVTVLKLQPSCDGVGATAYFDHFEECVKAMEAVR